MVPPLPILGDELVGSRALALRDHIRFLLPRIVLDVEVSPVYEIFESGDLPSCRLEPPVVDDLADFPLVRLRALVVSEQFDTPLNSFTLEM
jgi:hypothetical protein